MTISEAFKKFFFKLNGQEPTGANIAEIVANGSDNVQANSIKYEDSDAKSFVLKSSTAESTKEFRITVIDDGTITATEIVAESPGE